MIKNVVALQVLGDQSGGGLGGVQRVQGPHHAGGAQAGQQVAGGGALAALVADLPLPQDRAGGVVDGGDQEHPPAVGCAGPAQRLPVHRRRGQQPARGRVLEGALGHAAFLPLGRTGCGSHDWDRYGAAGDIGGPTTDRGVQRVGVQVGQHTPEGSLTGHQEPAGQRVAAGLQVAEPVLGDPRGPLPDRGHRVAAHHQCGARRQRQHDHQRVPPTPPPTQVRNLRQPRHQGGLPLGRVDGRGQLTLGQTGQLVKRGLRRARCGHERGSRNDLQASTPERSPEPRSLVTTTRRAPVSRRTHTNHPKPGISHQNGTTPGPWSTPSSTKPTGAP